MKIQQRGCFFTNVIMETGQNGIYNAALSFFYDEWRAVSSDLLAEVMPKQITEE